MSLIRLSLCRQIWCLPEGEERRGETIWLRWKGLFSQTPSLSWLWRSNAFCLLARKYSVALVIASPRHVFTSGIWIRTAVILHFCCCLLLLYVCTTEIKITWCRASVNWTVRWQRGDYWDTGRINDLSLFVKNMYSHVEKVLFSPAQWAFSSKVHLLHRRGTLNHIFYKNQLLPSQITIMNVFF